jgi:glucokinase
VRGGGRRETVAAVALEHGVLNSALVDRDGVRHRAQTSVVPAEASPSSILERIGNAVATLRDGHPDVVVRAAAVTVPAASGLARAGPGLRWQESPLAAELRRLVDLPVTVGDSSRAFALAEARQGAGRGEPSVLAVSLGDEIAAGYVRDGFVDEGAAGLAGAFGHVLVRPGGGVCDCGAAGCLSVYAGAARLADRYSHFGPPITAADVLERATGGDRRAVSISGDAEAALADALAMAVAVLDPAVLVLGGPVLAGTATSVRTGPAFAARVWNLVDRRLGFRSAPAVRPAVLGGAAAVLGTAIKAWDLLDGRLRRTH